MYGQHPAGGAMYGQQPSLGGAMYGQQPASGALYGQPPMAQYPEAMPAYGRYGSPYPIAQPVAMSPASALPHDKQ
jgi:hypothetical protein